MKEEPEQREERKENSDSTAGLRAGLGSEKGIALVFVLVLSLISLAMVSAMLFMLTQGTKTSGYHRFFRTAEEAGLGGTQLSAEFIKARGVLDPSFVLNNNLTYSDAVCLNQKLTTARGLWAGATGWTSCGSGAWSTLDASVGADMTYETDPTLVTGFNYRVYAKIVDTVIGNTECNKATLGTPAGSLGGSGVVASTSGVITPPTNPCLYRMEVQSEDAANPRERSKYTVLYAY